MVTQTLGPASLSGRPSWWTQPELRRGVWRRLLQVLALQAFTAVLFFSAAGTLAWSRGWVYLGLTILLLTATSVYVLPRNPDAVVARGHLPKGSTMADTIIVPIYSACTVGLYVVAGLDTGRFGWAPLSWPWALVGAALMTVGTMLTAAAMSVNRNLENMVRIQTERGHAVATSGPYAVVRHPMYVGLFCSLPGAALLLGSAWAVGPAVAAMVVLTVRTHFEDRTLMRQLPGYAEYARRTRYRLLPGVW